MSTPLLSSNTAHTVGAAAVNIANEARFSFLKNFREQRLSNLKPLGEFFDRNRFNLTSSFPEITKRWNYNLQYFSTNYLLIVLALSIYSLFSSFWVFFTVLFLVGGFYMLSRVEGPLNIGGTSINTTSLYGGYAILTIVLLLFSGVTGAIFWIIGAAALIILFHAAVLEPGLEGEFDDQV